MKLGLKTKLATALLASFVLMPLQISSVSAQTTEAAPATPILGFVTLGKTTVGEAQKLLDEKKCDPEYSFFYGVQFDGTCLGLPLQPAVRLIVPEDMMPKEAADARAMHKEPPKDMLNMPINVVQLGFWEYSKKTFDEYFPRLQKEWGEPNQCFPAELRAYWTCNGIDISIRDDKITYMKAK